MIGAVWPGLVYFPDYSKNVTREWWITLIKEFQELIAFDGLWIVSADRDVSIVHHMPQLETSFLFFL